MTDTRHQSVPEVEENRGEQARQRRIVVGVDGSQHARAALAWAQRQARLTGAALEVVAAWDYPQFYGMYGWTPVLEDPGLEQIAERLARDTAEAVLGAQPDIAAVIRVRQGPPGRALVEAARGAELLVVGSRGLGAVAGALLGSVSQHAAHHCRRSRNSPAVTA
jgi:nucleotide-binding universal stress UspA family protein